MQKTVTGEMRDERWEMRDERWEMRKEKREKRWEMRIAVEKSGSGRYED